MEIRRSTFVVIAPITHYSSFSSGDENFTALKTWRWSGVLVALGWSAFTAWLAVSCCHRFLLPKLPTVTYDGSKNCQLFPRSDSLENQAPHVINADEIVKGNSFEVLLGGAERQKLISLQTCNNLYHFMIDIDLKSVKLPHFIETFLSFFQLVFRGLFERLCALIIRC